MLYTLIVQLFESVHDVLFEYELVLQLMIYHWSFVHEQGKDKKELLGHSYIRVYRAKKKEKDEHQS